MDSESYGYEDLGGTYYVAVKYGSDGTVTIVARGVDFPTASSASAQHKTATRYIIRESSDAIVRTYRP